MTREEAIEMLNKWGVLFPSEASEAVDMAIEALQAFDAIIEDIQDSHLGDWYVGRIDGKSEEVIPTATVYNIIGKYIPKGGDDA